MEYVVKKSLLAPIKTLTYCVTGEKKPSGWAKRGSKRHGSKGRTCADPHLLRSYQADLERERWEVTWSPDAHQCITAVKISVQVSFNVKKSSDTPYSQSRSLIWNDETIDLVMKTIVKHSEKRSWAHLMKSWGFKSERNAFYCHCTSRCEDIRSENQQILTSLPWSVC